MVLVSLRAWQSSAIAAVCRGAESGSCRTCRVSWWSSPSSPHSQSAGKHFTNYIAIGSGIGSDTRRISSSQWLHRPAKPAQCHQESWERVWELIAARHGRIPPSRTCYGDLGETIVIRIDASLIDSHSDKERADGNFKGGYGFHPLLAFCDNTGELLAVIPRSGNAGSNTAADHIAIIDAAIAAIPAREDDQGADRVRLGA